MAESLAGREDVYVTTAERIETPDDPSPMDTDGGFREDVEKESSPSDVSDSSPKKTLAEVLREQLKESNENNIENPDGDTDPDSDEPEPEAGPESTVESKTQKASEEDQPASDEDPADIPKEEFEALGAKSQNRFQSLVNERNEYRDVIAPLKQYQEEVHATIKAANSTPEQMADMLEFTRMENSSNPDDNRAALNLAIAKAKDLARKLGAKVDGYNPLSDHEDLSERVDLGEIDPEDAEELAQARAQKRYQDELKAKENQSLEAAKKEEEANKMVALSIQTQFDNWRKTDPDFSEKQRIMLGKMSRVKDRYQKTQYLSVIQDMYADISDELVRAKPKPDPREVLPGGSSTAASSKVEPKDHREAVAQTLRASRV